MRDTIINNKNMVNIVKNNQKLKQLNLPLVKYKFNDVERITNVHKESNYFDLVSNHLKKFYNLRALNFYIRRNIRRGQRIGRGRKNFHVIFDKQFWRSIGTWKPFTIKYIKNYRRLGYAGTFRRHERRKLIGYRWNNKLLPYYKRVYHKIGSRRARTGITYRKHKKSRYKSYTRRNSGITRHPRTLYSKRTYRILRKKERRYTKGFFTLKPAYLRSNTFRKRTFTKGVSYTMGKFKRKYLTNRLHTRKPQWLRLHSRRIYTKSAYTRKFKTYSKNSVRKTYRFFSRVKYQKRFRFSKLSSCFLKKNKGFIKNQKRNVRHNKIET